MLIRRENCFLMLPVVLKVWTLLLLLLLTPASVSGSESESAHAAEKIDLLNGGFDGDADGSCVPPNVKGVIWRCSPSLQEVTIDGDISLAMTLGKSGWQFEVQIFGDRVEPETDAVVLTIDGIVVSKALDFDCSTLPHDLDTNIFPPDHDDGFPPICSAWSETFSGVRQLIEPARISQSASTFENFPHLQLSAIHLDSDFFPMRMSTVWLDQEGFLSPKFPMIPHPPRASVPSLSIPVPSAPVPSAAPSSSDDRQPTRSQQLPYCGPADDITYGEWQRSESGPPYSLRYSRRGIANSLVGRRFSGGVGKGYDIPSVAVDDDDDNHEYPVSVHKKLRWWANSHGGNTDDVHSFNLQFKPHRWELGTRTANRDISEANNTEANINSSRTRTFWPTDASGIDSSVHFEERPDDNDYYIWQPIVRRRHRWGTATSDNKDNVQTEEQCRLPIWDAGRFCDVLNRRSILIVGDSFQEEIWRSLLYSLGAPTWLPLRDSDMQWNVGNVIQVCGGLSHIRFIWNPFAAIHPVQNRTWYRQVDFLEAAREYDIVIISAGAHWVGLDEFERIISQTSAELKEETNATVFFRTIAPGHPNCMTAQEPMKWPPHHPLPSSWQRSKHHVGKYHWTDRVHTNAIASHIFRRDGHHIIDTANAIALRPDQHEWVTTTGAFDCNHFRLPGPPDLDVSVLFSYLLWDSESDFDHESHMSTKDIDAYDSRSDSRSNVDNASESDSLPSSEPSCRDWNRHGGIDKSDPLNAGVGKDGHCYLSHGHDKLKHSDQPNSEKRTRHGRARRSRGLFRDPMLNSPSWIPARVYDCDS